MLCFEKEFWCDFQNLYNMTKEMYIKSEEYDEDFCSIMQPIKEQRDALDHIVRSYACLINSDDIEKDAKSKKYIEKNFEKALGHIYRAFYDTADVLTIILREHISKYLDGFSYKEIVSCWSEYEKTRKELEGLPKRISRLRYNKEIKFETQEQQKIFDEYKEILDFLFKTLDFNLLKVKYKKGR